VIAIDHENVQMHLASLMKTNYFELFENSPNATVEAMTLVCPSIQR
jgi:hypothetical protein